MNFVFETSIEPGFLVADGDQGLSVIGVPLAGSRPGGRRRTRGLRPLRQLRRTSPPVAPLLSGSEGAFTQHRAFTGTPCVISESTGVSAFASITHARPATRGDSEKPLLSRRAAQQRAGLSGAAV